jgi:hypothetical protein
VTIGPGEAFVDGRYLATDESFSVNLPSSTTTTVFLGARDGAADSIIVDESSVFGSDDVRTPLFDFETDSSGVQTVTDRRLLGTDIIEIPTLNADSVDVGTVVTTDLSVDGAVNGSLSVGNTVSADTVDVTDVDADQLGKSTSPPNAEISDLSVSGSVNGIRELIVVQSESNLPAVDPPQIAFVQDKNEYQRSLNQQGFDIGNATFQKSIATGAGLNTGLAFNNDGSRLFFSGANDEIVQLSLSTNFDIGTATQQKTQSVTSPSDVGFNDDGSKMFVADDFQDEIVQFSLSTNFDIGTATRQKSLSTQKAEPRGFAFNNSGTRLFIIDNSGNPNEISQFRLDTAFDLGSGTLKKSITAQGAFTTGVTLNDDGTRLFETSRPESLIFESELAVPFDIGTAGFVRSVPSEDGEPAGITFGKSGTRLYEIGEQSNEISQSDVSGSPEFVSFDS